MNLRGAAAVLVSGLFLFMSSPVAASQAERTGWPSCRVAQLSSATGPQISPATGQNPLTLRLTNRARRPCTLHGYPTITFADERGAIPFPISHEGDQMIAPRRPTRVVVRAGRSVFVLVDKFRCDRGNVRVARTLRLGLPSGKPAQLSLALPRHPVIAYCGKGDPQSTIVTSPFEPSVAAALRRH